MTNSMSDWRLTHQWPGWALLFVVVSVTSSCNTAHAPDAPPRPPGGRDTGVQRPAFSIGDAEPFDAARIPAYGGDHAGIYADIDRHQAQHRENLRRWLRQPSISAENVGIQQMAEMVRGDLQRIGFKEAEIVPTSGHPGVWGYYDAGADRTLAVYMMYDVQPVEAEGWQVPAFEAPLVDHRLGRVVIARGATNQKGPQRAFLNAVEAIIRTTGSLPVNLMILGEGEEELGGAGRFARLASHAGARLVDDARRQHGCRARLLRRHPAAE